MIGLGREEIPKNCKIAKVEKILGMGLYGLHYQIRWDFRIILCYPTYLNDSWLSLSRNRDMPICPPPEIINDYFGGWAKWKWPIFAQNPKNIAWQCGIAQNDRTSSLNKNIFSKKNLKKIPHIFGFFWFSDFSHPPKNVNH